MSSRRRRHARSPPAAPLDDDDLLSEILLRLPPQPSSLPRASLVCKRWRGLVSDPGFFRRFRLRHRRSPPLLGFFDRYEAPFRPTLEAPNRVPPERFSLQHHEDEDLVHSFSHGCRHGLLLISLLKRRQFLVWDPVTGDQHRIPFPPPFDTAKTLVNAAVLRDAGDVQHFQVVLAVAGSDAEHRRRALACIYSSKTGLWGDFVSTPIPYHGDRIPSMVITDDAVLDGHSLYWKLVGNLIGILEFDLKKQTLAVIQVPVDILEGNSLQVMRAEGGGLGFLFVSDSNY